MARFKQIAGLCGLGWVLEVQLTLKIHLFTVQKSFENEKFPCPCVCTRQTGEISYLFDCTRWWYIVNIDCIHVF